MRIRDAVAVMVILAIIGSCEAAQASAPTGYRLETRKTGWWPFRGEEKVLVPNPTQYQITSQTTTTPAPATVPVTVPQIPDLKLEVRRQAAMRKIIDGPGLRTRFVAGIDSSVKDMTPEAKASLPAGWAERFKTLMVTRGYEEYLADLERDVTATFNITELEELAATGSFAGPKATKVLGWAHASCLKAAQTCAQQAVAEDPGVLEKAAADAHRLAAARAARRLAGMDILSVK
jgi:hypothetical protein